MSLSKQKRLGDVLTYLAYLVIIAFFIIPLLWILSMSIRSPQEVYLGNVKLIPDNPTAENYRQVLQNPRFLTYLWNGLKLSVVGAFGAMLVAAPAAYAFSRFRFRGRYAWMIALLAVQMLSPLVIMVPLYRYFDRLNLLDSHLGASFVYIAVVVPLFTWMLKGFIDGIPRSIEDAALIDGCSRFGAFVRITLPLSLPGLTSAFVLSAILGWSQFIVPFILLSRPQLLPVAVGIFNFQGQYFMTSTQLVAAAGVLSVLPALALFVLIQRLIIDTLMASGVKG